MQTMCSNSYKIQITNLKNLTNPILARKDVCCFTAFKKYSYIWFLKVKGLMERNPKTKESQPICRRCTLISTKSK